MALSSTLTLYVLVLASVLFLANSQDITVTLYDDINYGGDNIRVTVPQTGCRNVLEFNDRTSSVRTNGCVRLWEHANCEGRSIQVNSPGEPNFVSRSFNDEVSSVSTCSTEGPSVVITVDTSDAPELAEFGRKIKKIMEDWFPFVENLMRTTAYKPVKTINVYFDPKYDGVAYAAGNRIVGAVQYYRNNQRDYGSFIHEMTHVIHQSRNCPGWLVEGYAEWTRRWFYEPWTAQKKPSPNESYRDGYTTTAWLMVYINSAITEKPVLYYLNKACQEGSYYDGIWQDLTGKTVDQLWQDMLSDTKYPWKQ